MSRTFRFRSAPPPVLNSSVGPNTPGTPAISLSGSVVTGSFINSTAGSYGVIGYKLYRQTGGAGAYTYWQTIPGASYSSLITGTTFTDATLGLNVQVRYQVSAIDARPGTPNESSLSAASNSVTTPSAPPTSSTAPSVPFMLPPVAAAGAVTFSAIQSTSHHDGTTAGAGIDEYPWKKDTVAQTAINEPSTNILGVPTLYDIGTVTPTATRLGVDWNLQVAIGSTGIDGISDQIGLQGWAYTSIKSVNATLTPLTGASTGTFPGNYSSAGIMLRDTSSAGSPFIAAYFTPAGYAYCKWRSVPNATPLQSFIFWPSGEGSLAIQAVGDGTYNVYASTGTGSPTLIKQLLVSEIILTDTGIAGVFVSSLTADSVGTTALDISIAPTALVSTTVTTTAVVDVEFAAKSGATTSSYSPVITGTPTGTSGAGALKTTFGWYPWFVPGTDKMRPDLATPNAEIKAFIDEIETVDEIQGLQVYCAWKSLEADTEGNYTAGLAWVEDLLDYAEAAGKKIMLMPIAQTFSGFGGGMTYVYPAYVVNDSDKGVLTFGTGTPTCCRLWEAPTRTSFSNMCEAYGAALDSHPALEMWTFGIESAIRWEPITPPASYTYANFLTQLKLLFADVRAAFPTTAIRMNVNDFGPDSNFVELYDTAELHTIALGGPDSWPGDITQSDRVYQGKDQFGVSVYRDRRPELCWVAEAQNQNFAGWGFSVGTPRWTLDQTFNMPDGYNPTNGDFTMGPMYPRYRVWIQETYYGDATTQWAAQKAYMIAHPYSTWISASYPMPNTYVNYGVSGGTGTGDLIPAQIQTSSIDKFTASLTASVTLTGVVAGNSIIVLVSHANYDFDGAGCSVSDGTAYSLAVRQSFANASTAEIFYLHNVASGSHTITATALFGTAGNSNGQMVAIEVENLLNAAPDKITSATAESNAPATGSSGTLTQVHNFVATILMDDYPAENFAGGTWPMATYTSVINDLTGAEVPTAAGYKVVAATTAVSADLGGITSALANWAAALAVFKAA